MTDLPLDLPSPLFETRWLRLRDWHSSWVREIMGEFDRVCRKPGWNPKLIRLSGDTYMVDLTAPAVCGKPDCEWSDLANDIPHSVKVIEYVDHPLLAKLPTNAPRLVRARYTKEVRMRYLRASEGFNFLDDERRAAYAWGKYLLGGDSVEHADRFLAAHPEATVVFDADGVRVTAG